MQRDYVPTHANVVLVPVANPNTATLLLNLALAFAEPEDGQVLALIIAVGGAESAAQTKADIQKTVESLMEAEPRIKLITRVATSVTRGILDTLREVKASLLILGTHRGEDGRFSLGTIVENVATTATCDVLIYRAEAKPDFYRIVVAADGSPESKVACQLGLMLAHQQTPMDAVYVQEYDRPEWEGFAHIERSLEGLNGQDQVKRQVVTAHHFAAGLLNHVHEGDILIVGISESRRKQQWFSGEVSKDLLNRAPCPVLFAARSISERRPQNLIKRMRYEINHLMPTLSLIEQDEMAWQAHRMALPSVDYFVLIVIAASIASFGLLLNNTAVIIGAMLVAPLMQPLVALAIGVTTLSLELIRRGITTLLSGIGVALCVSFVVGFIMPHDTPTSEMLARGMPTWMDIGVALASGFIGAYATARKDIPAALAGVAIAAALMPPLCTVGLQIMLGNLELGLDAALLFLANIMGITFMALVVFIWLGMRPHKVEIPQRRFFFNNK